jgi:hypothetical protein
VGVAVLALVAGCGESPLRGALRARERVRCEAIDRCCIGNTETVDQCVERRMTSTEILGELARDEGALRRGEARFDFAAVDACVEAVTRPGALRGARRPVPMVSTVVCPSMMTSPMAMAMATGAM